MNGANTGKPLICHVITGLGVGGAERMLERIVTLSDKFRHEVIVLATRGPIGDSIAEAGIPVTPLDVTRRSDLPALIGRLRSRLLASRPSLVQSWLIHANLATSLTVPRGTPLLWSVRHTLEGFKTENVPTRLAVYASGPVSRRAKAIVYNSEAAARQHERLGYRADRRVVIPNGFAITDPAAIGPLRRAARQSLGVADDEVVVGLVARAHPIKNHGGLLAAAAQLAPRFPHARFALIGKGTEADGALAADCPPQLHGKTLWLGERPDAAELAAGFDIATNVSHGEAFSNTVGEAMSLCVPCLVTPVGESATIVGDTGWIAGSSSPDAIRAALEQALGASHDERRRKGAAAHRRIAEQYSIAAVVTRYERLYASLIERR